MKLVSIGLIVACAASARADGYIVFLDDRAGFESALQVDSASSVVDSGGAFAADPSAAGGVASVARSGTVAGGAFSYTAHDVNFSNAPTGTITPGSAGGDVSSTSSVDVETPAAQGGATGAGTWGVDSAGGGTTTRNALLVAFTTTPGGLGVGHFALDLLDFDAVAAGVQAQLRLYSGGTLVFTHDFDWGAGTGTGQDHFLGVVGIGTDSYFDAAAVVIGGATTSSANGAGYAADRITFGQATFGETVVGPEPGTFALVALGLGVLALSRRARRRPDQARIPKVPMRMRCSVPWGSAPSDVARSAHGSQAPRSSPPSSPAACGSSRKTRLHPRSTPS